MSKAISNAAMTRTWLVALTIMSNGVFLQGEPKEQRVISMEALRFLEGNWEAKTSTGTPGPAVTGTYSFRKELDGHILARHGSNDTCKGPADFDCDHHDLLYVYQDAAGQPLHAIYFDNEGHVIRYDVFASTPANVTFLSGDSVPGPRFRLFYELRDGVMAGKFQMQMPGQSEWKSYLEWIGGKK